MSAGNPLGIPIFIFFYGICQSIMKYYMLKYGYIYRQVILLVLPLQRVGQTHN